MLPINQSSHQAIGQSSHRAIGQSSHRGALGAGEHVADGRGDDGGVHRPLVDTALVLVAFLGARPLQPVREDDALDGGVDAHLVEKLVDLSARTRGGGG
eukprot:5228035-Prymnesium_polylepis.1